jgi:hypothetical protein
MFCVQERRQTRPFILISELSKLLAIGGCKLSKDYYNCCVKDYCLLLTAACTIYSVRNTVDTPTYNMKWALRLGDKKRKRERDRESLRKRKRKSESESERDTRKRERGRERGRVHVPEGQRGFHFVQVLVFFSASSMGGP